MKLLAFFVFFLMSCEVDIEEKTCKKHEIRCGDVCVFVDDFDHLGCGRFRK